MQLIYLASGEVLSTRPSLRSVEAVERRALALWAAVERACKSDDFRPNPGRLCAWCGFRPYCPAWGGNPVEAAELRPSEPAGKAAGARTLSALAPAG